MSAESKAAIQARERARRGEPEPKPKKAKKVDEPAPVAEADLTTYQRLNPDTVTES